MTDHKADVEQLAKIAESVSAMNARHARTRPLERVIAQTGEGIFGALDEFMECVRYLNTRRSNEAVLELDSEGAVQDAIFLMLRPWIRDLVPESPTMRIANRYSLPDFVAASAQTIIEAKYIRDKNHGKTIVKELHDDIETYRHLVGFSEIIFFVYDPEANIPDAGALRRQVEEARSYSGVALRCRLLVKP